MFCNALHYGGNKWNNDKLEPRPYTILGGELRTGTPTDI